jgi:hypothetical protein
MIEMNYHGPVDRSPEKLAAMPASKETTNDAQENRAAVDCVCLRGVMFLTYTKRNRNDRDKDLDSRRAETSHEQAGRAEDLGGYQRRRVRQRGMRSDHWDRSC